MGKSTTVKQHEKISAFNPSQVKALRSTGPYRSAVFQFRAPQGKFSVLATTKDEALSGFYKMRFYFACPESQIEFHSEIQRKTIMHYGVERLSLYKSNLKNNANARRIMTPYALDGFFNQVCEKSEIYNNKVVFEQSGKFYEDNAPGSLSCKSKLVAAEVQSLNAEQLR